MYAATAFFHNHSLLGKLFRLTTGRQKKRYIHFENVSTQVNRLFREHKDRECMDALCRLKPCFESFRFSRFERNLLMMMRRRPFTTGPAPFPYIFSCFAPFERLYPCKMFVPNNRKIAVKLQKSHWREPAWLPIGRKSSQSFIQFKIIWTLCRELRKR